MIDNKKNKNKNKQMLIIVLTYKQEKDIKR